MEAIHKIQDYQLHIYVGMVLCFMGVLIASILATKIINNYTREDECKQKKSEK